MANPFMTTWLAVAAGGALGALARYLLSGWLTLSLGRGFPWGTFGVNLIGCCLIGALYVWITQEARLAPVWQAVLVAGFTGAFTTFSTFALETLSLLESGRAATAMLYAAGSLVLGLGGVALGMKMARLFI
jgi:CrcB protein